MERWLVVKQRTFIYIYKGTSMFQFYNLMVEYISPGLSGEVEVEVEG